MLLFESNTQFAFVIVFINHNTLLHHLLQAGGVTDSYESEAKAVKSELSSGGQHRPTKASVKQVSAPTGSPWEGEFQVIQSSPHQDRNLLY